MRVRALHESLFPRQKGGLSMKPEYANTFGIRKVSDKDGEVLEVTLDIAYK